MAKVILGLLASLLIAGFAFQRKALSLSGAGAAVVIGTLLFVLGHVLWYGVLLAFFISSSFLSRYQRRAKASLEHQYEKSGARDAGQVLANGGLGALCCAMNAIVPHPLWFFAFLGGMAAVTADTWATEIGGLSRRSPISVITGRKVLPGASGGVTPLGFGASLAGAAFIGLTAVVLSWFSEEMPAWTGGQFRLILFVTAGGWIGSIMDSYIGAIWQRMYRCDVCDKETEKKVHCDVPCQQIRGVRWMNNNAVNLICSLTGAFVVVLLTGGSF